MFSGGPQLCRAEKTVSGAICRGSLGIERRESLGILENHYIFIIRFFIFGRPWAPLARLHFPRFRSLAPKGTLGTHALSP